MLDFTMGYMSYPHNQMNGWVKNDELCGRFFIYMSYSHNQMNGGVKDDELCGFI